MPTNQPQDSRRKPAPGEVAYVGPLPAPSAGIARPPISAKSPLLDQTVAALEQLRPGQMLGQYQIVEHLGSGGMGQVFKAIHSAMQRTVALKVIAPELTQDAQTLARFQREMRSAGRLSHPNVVVAHDAS